MSFLRFAFISCYCYCPDEAASITSFMDTDSYCRSERCTIWLN